MGSMAKAMKGAVESVAKNVRAGGTGRAGLERGAYDTSKSHRARQYAVHPSAQRAHDMRQEKRDEEERYEKYGAKDASE